MRIFKKHRKLYTAYMKTAVIAAIFLAVAIPFARRMASADTFISFDYTRYLVSLNGRSIGYVLDKEDADAALLEARARLSSEEDGLALVASELSVTEVTTQNDVLTEKELANAIYLNLTKEAVSTETERVAYTVRIDDFTVTLASLEEVEELFEMVKDKYLDADNFSIELEEEDTGVYSAYKTSFVTADVEVNEAAKVLASEDGAQAAAEDEEVTYTDGVLSVDFVQNIEVIETKEYDENLMTLDEAYEAITKEHAERGTYTVQSGDCLSSIATKCGLSLDELYSMNEGLNADSTIYAGDVLTITVPASEISMQVVEEQSYNENYAGEVQYVDNANLYTGTENVIQNGVDGERAVVALVTYVNGVETNRDIISQTVITEPVPKIVERGTMTPPTYLWPVYSTWLTQYFGENGHSGVDIYVPSGTSVKATASGTIVYAGWKGDLGYCVEISHGNGMVTRYGHLSSIAVSYGQWVNQGQVVAYSGSTGRSTGPHLHVSMLLWGGLVNPLNYLSY